MSTHDALIEGGRTRVRPILMTAFATILALIPLAAGFNQGSIIASELGTVVIGGLFSSTLLTLLVVPVVYSLVDGVRTRWRGGAAVDDASSGAGRAGWRRARPARPAARQRRVGASPWHLGPRARGTPLPRLPQELTHGHHPLRRVTWTGDLATGSGTINYVSSGAFTRLPVTWASRTEEHNGRDQPGGAARRGSRVVLLDGVHRAPRQERHARRRSWTCGPR